MSTQPKALCAHCSAMLAAPVCATRSDNFWLLHFALVFICAFGLGGHTALATEKDSCSNSLWNDSPSVDQIVQRIIDRHLDETERVAQAIVRQFPMAKYEYVLVGRSPTLLAAYFEAQKSIFSGLRSWVLPISLKNSREVGMQELSRRFASLFNLFRNVDETRVLLFIDVVNKGRTFKVLDRLLLTAGQKIEFVGLSPGAPPVIEGVVIHHIQISQAMEDDLGSIKTLAPFEVRAIESERYVAPSVPESPKSKYLNLLNHVKRALGL